MKVYQEITLLPDSDENINFLWQKVYQQIHLALVEIKGDDNKVGVGVSFPNYQYGQSGKHVGNKLRLIAQSEDELAQVNIKQWLSKLQDYVHVTSIRDVPNNAVPVKFSHKRIKSLRRSALQRAKYLGISVEIATSHLSKNGNKKISDLPFVQMISHSTGDKGEKHRFRLFIEQTQEKSSTVGRFDSYGLSKEATVPSF